jgi:hypothetical protein
MITVAQHFALFSPSFPFALSPVSFRSFRLSSCPSHPTPPAAHNHRLGKEVEAFHTLREERRQRGRCAAARNDYRWYKRLFLRIHVAAGRVNGSDSALP